MTTIEKQLIRSFILGKMTKEEFLKSYPVDLIRDKQYILSTLLNAYREENAVDTEYALMLLPLDDFSGSKKYVDILNKLMLANWHYRHEDIAALLKGIKAPESVDALYKAALVSHGYLDYDETYQLARKCIKALATIGNAEAIEKLQMIAGHAIPEIREYAQKELRYKELL